jgi:hypothetical protein
MLTREPIFRIGDTERIWEKFCGFFDLSMQEFMDIQNELLMEEIELVADSPLGKKIMNNQKPKSLEEFRQLVPLTTYENYTPYLDQKIEDALSQKPVIWAHTSGRSGSFKWIPYMPRYYQKLIDNVIGGFILACATRKGEVNLKGGERGLCNIPPPPYASGIVVRGLSEVLGLKIIPPLELSDTISFRDRIEIGFIMALRTKIDMVGSLTSVLVKIGESFTERTGGMKFSTSMLHPYALFRIGKAFLRNKIKKRPVLPKDLWSVKGIFCAGTDTSIYKDKVVYYWGKEPYEQYGPSELGNLAMQSWTKKTMTFIPYLSFLEFIPEREWLKNREDKKYQPQTVLLNELKEGEIYEVVGTGFYGMPFLRYRPGDLIKIVSLRDDETGIDIPQMVFKSRADDIIDLASFTRLDEKTIWQAITNTGIRYEDWTARKEYINGKPSLLLYIEIKDEINNKNIGILIHNNLKAIDHFYNDLEDMLEINPVQVILLSKGTFERYYFEKQAAGLDLAHLKPPHINALDSDIETLLRLSKVAEE